jgi:hypothetical protein
MREEVQGMIYRKIQNAIREKKADAKELMEFLDVVKTCLSIVRLNQREERRWEKSEKTVWYLCDGDRKGCSKRGCYTNGGPCKYTKDIRSAKNFEKEREGRAPYAFREKETAPGADAVGEQSNEMKQEIADVL